MADARISQVTVDQLADIDAALAARISQVGVDYLYDDIVVPEVRLSQIVVDYFQTAVSQCSQGGGIGVLPDEIGGEIFTGRDLRPRAWLALGFDA